jgi:hypothetical protein
LIYKEAELNIDPEAGGAFCTLAAQRAWPSDGARLTGRNTSLPIRLRLLFLIRVVSRQASPGQSSLHPRQYPPRRPMHLVIVYSSRHRTHSWSCTSQNN